MNAMEQYYSIRMQIETTLAYMVVVGFLATIVYIAYTGVVNTNLNRSSRLVSLVTGLVAIAMVLYLTFHMFI